MTQFSRPMHLTITKRRIGSEMRAHERNKIYDCSRQYSIENWKKNNKIENSNFISTERERKTITARLIASKCSILIYTMGDAQKARAHKEKKQRGRSAEMDLVGAGVAGCLIAFHVELRKQCFRIFFCMNCEQRVFFFSCRSVLFLH